MERQSSGQLCVQRITQNSIYVKWSLSRISRDAAHSSPPFALINEGCAIPFHLSFKYSTGIITVEQTTTEIGRAIITVAVNDGNYMNAIRVKFTENWENMCTFRNLGQLPQSTNPQNVPLFGQFSRSSNQQSLDQNPSQTLVASNVTIFCKIIWLGFASDAILPKLPLSPLSIANVPFNNTENSDFTLIVENQEIPVHKTILARYIPVFSRMFQAPMMESKKNQADIGEFEFFVMQIIVDIIYRGETVKLDDIDTALKVLRAAERYEMSMIKTICECKLQLKITTDNVLELLQEADKYNAANLCETCVAYIFAVKDPKISREFRRIPKKQNIAMAVMNASTDQSLDFIPTEKV